MLKPALIWLSLLMQTNFAFGTRTDERISSIQFALQNENQARSLQILNPLK